MGENSYVDFGKFGVSAEEAARAFQLLTKYMALGGNSHAEAAQTMACGEYFRVEDFNNYKDGIYIIQNVVPIKPIPEEDLRIIFEEEVKLDFDE